VSDAVPYNDKGLIQILKRRLWQWIACGSAVLYGLSDISLSAYGERVMRWMALALLALSVCAANDASAQAVGSQSWIPNLAGIYRCVNHCLGPGVVRITQRGRELTLIDPSGRPASAWIGAPGHIWTAWQEGAVYSPDGFTIQFTGGTVWVLLEPTPVPGTVW
jgi:hypothetical protein